MTSQTPKRIQAALGRPYFAYGYKNSTLRPGAQRGVLVPVSEVEREPDDEPDAEADPGLLREAVHHVQARERTADGHRPDEAHAERTLAARVEIAQCEHARTHEHARPQRVAV